jgi:glycosyltransferase involved in cell wall biosynthesis
LKIILYISHTSDISGAERSLLEILSCLDKNKWKPIVIAPTGPLHEAVMKMGIYFIAIKLPVINKPKTLFDSLKLAWKLESSRLKISTIINEISPDVIHANTTRAMMLTPRTNIPVIWHLRDLALPCFITRILFSQANRIAVISDFIENEFIRSIHVNSSKFFHLPPSVNTDIFIPGTPGDFRLKYGLPADVPLIGMVAQFVSWKRHGLFLDALESISSRPWHAVLTGATFNSNDDYIGSITSRLLVPPLLGRVSVIDWVDDCQELYKAMDVSVLTSSNEPFGRVIIESMACGIPVVAVDEGGPKEIIRKGDTGILVEPNSAAIATAISYLLDNKEKRNKIALSARQYVIDNYNHNAMSERLDIIYADLTSRE